jgi:hypothetical protein
MSHRSKRRHTTNITFSRLLASIYGRPPMISRASDVRLPSDVDRDYNTVDHDGCVSQERIPGASMFCLSVKLLNIVYGILETVYLDFRSQTTSNSGSPNADVLAKALELDHQLDRCLVSMPDRLGSFITGPPSKRYDQACDFGLHEQALVTRSVISPRPQHIALTSPHEYRR